MTHPKIGICRAYTWWVGLAISSAPKARSGKMIVLIVLPQIAEYCQKLIGAVPLLRFDGPVSKHDECDDGIHLRRELIGKRRDELSPGDVFQGSIGLVLLETSAPIASPPAWFLRSMESNGLRHPLWTPNESAQERTVVHQFT